MAFVRLCESVIQDGPVATHVTVTGNASLQAWLYVGISNYVHIFCNLLCQSTATPPIAALSERYQNRKYPLICGQVFLIGSQILLMEAPTYWLMVMARVMQGVSSSMIWVVGLALLYV